MNRTVTDQAWMIDAQEAFWLGVLAFSAAILVGVAIGALVLKALRRWGS